MVEVDLRSSDDLNTSTEENLRFGDFFLKVTSLAIALTRVRAGLRVMIMVILI